MGIGRGLGGEIAHQVHYLKKALEHVYDTLIRKLTGRFTTPVTMPTLLEKKPLRKSTCIDRKLLIRNVDIGKANPISKESTNPGIRKLTETETNISLKVNLLFTYIYC